MNLSKLFEKQRQLDEHIMDEHPELKGQDNLDWKILALQVELGECANEWRGFKKWSKDQEPHIQKIVVQCVLCNEWTDYPHEVEGVTRTRYPLLEEYADGLHFALSIGLEISAEKEISKSKVESIKHHDITFQFLSINLLSAKVYDAWARWHWIDDAERILKRTRRQTLIQEYKRFLYTFLGLGEIFGFTWNQIEQAYFDKNEINHKRQEAGY